VDYYLPAAVSGPVTVEILDGTRVVSAYSSEAPAGGGRGRGRGGRGGGQADPDDPDAAMMAGRTARTDAVPGRVTKTAGLNRFLWDVRDEAGLSVPPGTYQVRVKAGEQTATQRLTVLIDPRVAADGVTVADLKEQYEHNTRARELVTAVNRLVASVREEQNRLRAAGMADSERGKKVEAVAAKLLTEPVRYGKPGLQAHITYLAGMTTRGDQKVGRDALERYQVLRKELDAIEAEFKGLGTVAGR
jgi:hypothetical protein